MTEPYYQDDAVTIYHGDCREVLPELTFDVIVTDPPYGLRLDNSRMPNATNHGVIAGDDSTELAEWLLARIPPSMPAAVFGANYFPHALPHRGRWVCWDKRCSEGADRILGSPFELAWINDRTRTQTEMIRVLHAGTVNSNGAGHGRVHPTEKSIPMLRRLLVFMSAPGTVADPFMGSGTTLRAAKDLGRKAIGIEIEERYCEIAARRMSQEVLDLGGAA